MTTTLFDIAADLDTPVSAYLKLKPFRPRFLLESVEGGERLARYSFIGFGDCLEYRLDAAGLMVNGVRDAPAGRPGRAAGRRCGSALARSPRPDVTQAGFPLLGGLVGAASYDLVRYFERLPSKARVDDGRAGRALRRAALGPGVRPPHAPCGVAARRPGAGAAGAAPRSDPALRGGLPGPVRATKFGPPAAEPVRGGVPAERRPHQGVHRRRRRLPARAVGAVRRPLRPRSVRGVPRAATAEPVAVHVLLRARRPRHRRLVARGAGEAERRRRAPAADRGHACRAAPTPGRTLAHRSRSCSPIRRRTPST